MSPLLRFVCCVAIVGSTAVHAAPEAIPFDFSRHAIGLQVQVKGKPLYVILDTGVDPSIIDLQRARELGAPRYEVAEALEKAALEELHARRPDRVLATNVEFWAAIMLDFAQVPAHMFTSMFTCARTAGWSAHILEQKRTGRLVRPAARYIGPGPRSPRDVAGFDDIAR